MDMDKLSMWYVSEFDALKTQRIFPTKAMAFGREWWAPHFEVLTPVKTNMTMQNPTI